MSNGDSARERLKAALFGKYAVPDRNRVGVLRRVVSGAALLFLGLSQANATSPSVGDVYQLTFSPANQAIQFGPTSGTGSFTISGDFGNGTYAVADLVTTFDYRITTFNRTLNTTVSSLTPISYASNSYYAPSPLRLTYDAGLNALRVFNAGMNSFDDGFSLRSTIQAPYAYMSDDYYPDVTIGNRVDIVHYVFNNRSATSSSFPAAIEGSYLISAPIPEPEAHAMMLAGLGLLAFMSRRRSQKVH